eukprot:TRINITY_DN10871_c1_g4_i1.p1 TRINITY_DN10871_c1_g4~~TRINITY_DN10871_c1_g4_i1.p1  ORF type:complete len:232 (+),score=36.70 TRINITY_DN10871_c1_g4_i1:177-872(+)
MTSVETAWRQPWLLSLQDLEDSLMAGFEAVDDMVDRLTGAVASGGHEVVVPIAVEMNCMAMAVSGFVVSAIQRGLGSADEEESSDSSRNLQQAVRSMAVLESPRELFLRRALLQGLSPKTFAIRKVFFYERGFNMGVVVVVNASMLYRGRRRALQTIRSARTTFGDSGFTIRVVGDDGSIWAFQAETFGAIRPDYCKTMLDSSGSCVVVVLQKVYPFRVWPRLDRPKSLRI